MPYQNEQPVSGDMSAIIGYRPRWIVREGNTVFLFILLLVVFSSWLIRYPETVKGSAHLLAVNAPKLLTAPASGRLEKMLVRNEEKVSAGQYLAFLQSTGRHEQVILLKEWIDTTLEQLPVQGLEILQKHPLVGCTELGELQAAYQSFQTTFLETGQLLSTGYYRRKKAALEKDLQYLLRLKASAGRQKQSIEQDRHLEEEEYKAYESLAKDKVIAPLELGQYKSRLLGKQQSVEDMEARLTLSDINSFNKKKELLDLDKQVFDQQQRFYSGLLSLKSAVEAWMERYIVRAPESGRVFFSSALEEHSWLESGQELFYVQSSATAWYAEVWIAQQGLGKIRLGQQVLLKPESYPAEEYGFLKGRVEYIYNRPNRHDSFLLKVSLPYGLTTSQHQPLFFRNDLSAQAEVITQNRRLLGRLLEPLQRSLVR